MPAQTGFGDSARDVSTTPLSRSHRDDGPETEEPPQFTLESVAGSLLDWSALMTQRSRPAAATLILTSLLACSSGSMRGPVAAAGGIGGGTGGQSGGTGAGGRSSVDGDRADHPASSDASDGNSPSGECRGELDEVGHGCPAMFDGTSENLPACKQLGIQQAWTCDDVIALSLGAGVFSVDCYYGASSHLLVGAMEVNDTNTLCGNSFTKTAGEVPTANCRFPVSMPTIYRPCMGADSGTH